MSASIRDVANDAGVSLGTVSNVLNRPDRVAPATAARVFASIERLGFVRNDAARMLRAGRSKTIGMIVHDVRNPFFTDVARGAEERAAQAGLSILLGNSDDEIEREAGYVGLFEEQRVLGVLIAPLREELEALHQLTSRGTPVVLVDRSDPQGRFPSVSVDDVAGGYMATRHLIDCGRKRIAFVGGPRSIRQVSDRLEGAWRAASESPGVTIEVIETSALTVLEGRSAGELVALREPGDRPDGIFAANDLLATGVLQAALMSDRLRVPDDIALIGYDDIDFASSAIVPLTSVRQPSALIGRTAIDLLLRDGESAGSESEQVVFQPELVVRASTRAQDGDRA